MSANQEDNRPSSPSSETPLLRAHFHEDADIQSLWRASNLRSCLPEIHDTVESEDEAQETIESDDDAQVDENILLDYSAEATKDIRPPFSYVQLIAKAILSQHEQQLALQGIYEWIRVNYAYYRHRSGSWQSSIRSQLASHKAFKKISQPSDPFTPWMLAPQGRKSFLASQNLSSLPSSTDGGTSDIEGANADEYNDGGSGCQEPDDGGSGEDQAGRDEYSEDGEDCSDDDYLESPSRSARVTSVNDLLHNNSTRPSTSTSTSLVSSKASGWSAEESQAAIDLMKVILNDPVYASIRDTERRFSEISRMMKSEYGFDRSPSGVKFQWNRYLRATSNIEDRGDKKRKQSLITSALGTPKKKSAAAAYMPHSRDSMQPPTDRVTRRVTRSAEVSENIAARPLPIIQPNRTHTLLGAQSPPLDDHGEENLTPTPDDSALSANARAQTVPTASASLSHGGTTAAKPTLKLRFSRGSPALPRD